MQSKLSKLETLKKDFATARANRGALEKEIAGLESKAAALREAAEAAAEADDPDLYTKKKREAEEVEDRIYVRKKALEKSLTCSEEEVLKGWIEYRQTQDKKVSAASAAIEDALDALKKAYMDYVRQFQTIEVEREESAALLGMNPGCPYYDEFLKGKFPLPGKNPGWASLRNFLGQCSRLSKEESDHATSALGFERPY